MKFKKTVKFDVRVQLDKVTKYYVVVIVLGKRKYYGEEYYMNEHDAICYARTIENQQG